MRMPDGNYEGCVFYVPNGMVELSDEAVTLNLPPDFTIRLKDNQSGEENELSVDEFVKEVDGKSER